MAKITNYRLLLIFMGGLIIRFSWSVEQTLLPDFKADAQVVEGPGVLSALGCLSEVLDGLIEIILVVETESAKVIQSKLGSLLGSL